MTACLTFMNLLVAAGVVVGTACTALVITAIYVSINDDEDKTR